MKSLIQLFFLLAAFKAYGQAELKQKPPSFISALTQVGLIFDHINQPKIVSFSDSRLDQFVVAELVDLRIEIETAKNIQAQDADKRLKTEVHLLNKLRKKRKTPYSGEVASQTLCTGITDTTSTLVNIGSISASVQFIGASHRFVLTNCQEELDTFTGIAFFYDMKNKNIQTIRVFKKALKKNRSFTPAIKNELVSFITSFRTQ